jgi:hypothetical protein
LTVSRGEKHARHADIPSRSEGRICLAFGPANDNPSGDSGMIGPACPPV